MRAQAPCEKHEELNTRGALLYFEAAEECKGAGGREGTRMREKLGRCKKCPQVCGGVYAVSSVSWYQIFSAFVKYREVTCSVRC